MPSDAKFGLVVGMVVVLLIALLFFRKEGSNEFPTAAPAFAAPPPRAVPLPAPKFVPPKIEEVPPPLPKPPVAPAVDDLPEAAPPAEPPPLPPPEFGKIVTRRPQHAIVA